MAIELYHPNYDEFMGENFGHSHFVPPIHDIRNVFKSFLIQRLSDRVYKTLGTSQGRPSFLGGGG